MSGLYNMFVPGGFERGRVLLPFLGIRAFDDFGRYRDCWVERDEAGKLWIRVYTRNGGDNRADWAEVILALRQHPLYERDFDDTFDSTYASFYFRVPDEHAELLAQVARPTVDTDQVWRNIIASCTRQQ